VWQGHASGKICENVGATLCNLVQSDDTRPSNVGRKIDVFFRSTFKKSDRIPRSCPMLSAAAPELPPIVKLSSNEQA